jgi:hypothetical protein
MSEAAKQSDQELAQAWQQAQDGFTQPGVEDLLGYLAAALGPLGRADLLRIDVEDALTGRTLGPALNSLGPLITGDDSAGYSFRHCGFRELARRHIADRLPRYEMKLLDYCRHAWREGSVYALRNVVAHLARAGRCDELQRLVLSGEFLRAKRLALGSHRSLSQDIDLAIQAAEHEGPAGVPHILADSLLDATLRSQASNVSPDVLGLLVDWGQVERAADYAELAVEPEQRAEAFRTVGGGGTRKWLALMTGGKLQLRPAYLMKALQEAEQIEDTEARARCLYALALELARGGDAEAAFDAIRRIEQEGPDEDLDRFARDARAQVPVQLARAGKPREALLALEHAPEDEYSRSKILGKISVALAQAEAEAVGRETQGRDADARAGGMEEPGSLEADRKRMAALFWLGRYDEALRILKSLRYADSSEITRDQLVEVLLAAGRPADALTVASKVSSSSLQEIVQRWQTEWATLRDLITEGNTDHALAAIREIQPESLRAEALAMCGVQLAQAGSMADVLALLQCNKYEYSFEVQGARLATYLARAGMVREAQQVTGIWRYDRHWRSTALLGIAGALIGAGRTDEVIPVARRLIESPMGRCKQIARMAVWLALVDEPQAQKLLESALAEAEVSVPDGHAAEPWAALAAQLAGAGKRAWAACLAARFALVRPEAWAEVVSTYVAEVAETDEAGVQAVLRDLISTVVRVEDGEDEEIRRTARMTLFQSLVRKLAARKRFAEAALVVEMEDDSSWRAFDLALLAGSMSKTDTRRATQLAEHAWNLAVQERKAGRGDPRAVVIAALVEAGWVDGALALFQRRAGRGLGTDARAFVAASLATALALEGRVDEALLWAAKSRKREEVLDSVVSHLLEHEKGDLALKILEHFPEADAWTIVSAQEAAALAFARQGKVTEVRQAVAAMARQGPDGLLARMRVVVALIESGLDDEARAVAVGLGNAEWTELANRLISSRAHQLEEEDRHKLTLAYSEHALAMADRLEAGELKAWLFAQSAPALAAEGRLDEVLARVRDVRSRYDRNRALAAIALQLVRAARVEAGIEVAKQIRGSQSRKAAWREIADALANVHPPEALRGMQLLLREARPQGREATCEMIARLAPLLRCLAGANSSQDIIRSTCEELEKVESLWHSPLQREQTCSLESSGVDRRP